MSITEFLEIVWQLQMERLLFFLPPVQALWTLCFKPQLTHTDSPTDAVYVPGAHAVAAVLAVPQLLPTMQLVHSVALPRLVLEEYEPAGHGNAADAPLGQYELGLHGLHSVAPVSF